VAILVAGVAVWLFVVVRHTSMAVGGADSSGYFNAARLFASGHVSAPVGDRVFMPFGFVPSTDAGRMVPLYPPGYPLHLALFGFARFLVTPFAAAVCLLLMVALARTLELSEGWSLAAALLLASSPPFLLMSMQQMSDVVSMMWCMAAMLFALRGKPIAAGAAFAVAVMVRPANVLLLLPLAFARRWRPRDLALAADGALPIAIAYAAMNHAMYGSWWGTGYGAFTNMLAWSNAIHHAPRYLGWLLVLQTPIVLLVAFTRERRALLLTWFGAYFVFYSFFEPFGDWGYTRFLLPALPALIAGALLPMRRYRLTWTIVAIVAVYCFAAARERHVFARADVELIYPRAVAWANRQISRSETIAAMQLSGSFYYYAGRLTLRYDQITTPIAPPRYAVVFDWEEPLLRQGIPGTWTRIGTLESVSLLRLDSMSRR